MKPTAFKAAMQQEDNVVVMDVRTPREIAEGKIDDAVEIDFLEGDFAEKVKDMDKDKSYYIYCRSGNRSGQACQIMSQMGFDKLVNLEGGMLAWQG